MPQLLGSCGIFFIKKYFILIQMRFERTTFRLGGGCSILLSYGSMYF